MSTSPLRRDITSPFVAARPLPRTASQIADAQPVELSSRDSVEIGRTAAPVPAPPSQFSSEEMAASSLTTAQRVAAGGFLGLALLGAFGCWAGTGSAPASAPAPQSSISATVDSPGSTGRETRVPPGDSPGNGSAIGRVAQVPTVDAASTTRGVRQFDNLELHDALRIDVVRSTRTEVVPVPTQVSEAAGEAGQAPGSPAPGDPKAPSVTSVTKASDLSPFGVDLGDGLFFDLNGNLTFNPLRVSEEYREITVDPAGLFNSTTVTRTENMVRIDPPGLLNSTVITQDGERTVIDPPGAFNEVTLTQRGGQTSISPPGFQGFVNPTSVVERGDALLYNPPGVFNSTTITRQGDQTRIAVPGWGNDVTVVKSGDTTRVAHPGWANDIVITRSGNQTTIDPFGLGNSIVITRTGDTIRVDPPGLGNSVIITLK